MSFESIHIDSYNFSAEEHYIAGIILDYLQHKDLTDKKSQLETALKEYEALIMLLRKAISETGASEVYIECEDDLSEEEMRYQTIIKSYQSRLVPEVFAQNVSSEFMDFLKDCLEKL